MLKQFCTRFTTNQIEPLLHEVKAHNPTQLTLKSRCKKRGCSLDLVIINIKWKKNWSESNLSYGKMNIYAPFRAAAKGKKNVWERSIENVSINCKKLIKRSRLTNALSIVGGHGVVTGVSFGEWQQKLQQRQQLVGMYSYRSTALSVWSNNFFIYLNRVSPVEIWYARRTDG